MATDGRPIGQLLKEMGLITEYEIQEALSVQKEKGGSLGRILVDMDFVDDKDLLFALAVQSGMEFMDLDDIDIPDYIDNEPPC